MLNEAQSLSQSPTTYGTFKPDASVSSSLSDQEEPQHDIVMSSSIPTRKTPVYLIENENAVFLEENMNTIPVEFHETNNQTEENDSIGQEATTSTYNPLHSQPIFDQTVHSNVQIESNRVIVESPQSHESEDWRRYTSRAQQYTLATSRPPKRIAMSNRSSVWLRSFGGTHRRYYRRLVFKSGERNFSCINIPRRSRRYLSDLFTTIIDAHWRVILTLFAFSFIVSWVAFGALWYFLLSVHGDLENYNKPNWKFCVLNVYDFSTAVLFSIETQHTIGYGVRSTTGNCPEAILLMMFQCCFGLVIQALMTGMVFAKLSRPKKRTETLMFSKNAVICRRDGVHMLLFRIGDMRKSHIIQAQIRAILLKKRITSESEVLPMEQYNVDLGFQDGTDRLFLAWPTLVAHRITGPSSPFWKMNADDFVKQQFELVIIMEGIVECTGMTTQARTSYLPSEILWGYRFQKLVTRQRQNGEYLIDFEYFHGVEPIENFPKESACDLSEDYHETRDQTELQALSVASLLVTNSISSSSVSNDNEETSSTNNILHPHSTTNFTSTPQTLMKWCKGLLSPNLRKFKS